MWNLARTVTVLFMTCVVAGCLYSEKQLSNDFNAAKPFPEMIRLSDHTRDKSGEWKSRDLRYLVRRSKYSFVYHYSKVGDDEFKEKQFALIPLNEPYYAFETPGKNGFDYEFWYISDSGIYRWELVPEIMNPILENRDLQRRLGVSCDDKKCQLNSVTTLKNIMMFILNQDIRPYHMYTVG